MKQSIQPAPISLSRRGRGLGDGSTPTKCFAGRVESFVTSPGELTRSLCPETACGETAEAAGSRLTATVPANRRDVAMRAARGFHFFVIPITNRCEAECPVCYAESHARGQEFLSLDRLRDAARRVKAAGGLRLSLSGGEPTAHPQLPEMIRLLREEIGLAPTLVTNGQRIADDSAYLADLQHAGLRRIHLQFDTLNPDNYRAIRGRSDLGEKFRAVDRIVAAGMQLGLIATVTSLNVGEARALVEYAQELAPAIRLLVFQPAVAVGRYPENLPPATRDEVVHALTNGAGPVDLTADDFLPFPRPRPARAFAHPDCSCHVLMTTDGRRSVPWSRHPDRLSRMQPGARGGEAQKAHRAGAGGDHPANVPQPPVRRVRRWHPYYISVISFMCPPHWDGKRLRQCVAASVTERSFQPLCQWCSVAARWPFD